LGFFNLKSKFEKSGFSFILEGFSPPWLSLDLGYDFSQRGAR